MDAAEHTPWLVEQARALGFDLCGVARARDLEELAHLPEWLARGHAGEMRYLSDPRRLDPARILDGAGSLIVCALNYNTPQPYSTEVPATTESENRNSEFETRAQQAAPLQANRVADMKSAATNGPRGWISRYAWGDDYHEVLGRKLDALLRAMREHFPEPFEARAYVDTGPVVERVAAKYAGLGWLAKNTCLINERLGSWLFLGVIVTTLDLEPSLGPGEPPPPDLCGQCRLCIEACPTNAIVEPYVLDARRCISYLTIELRGSIPEEFRAPMGRHAFGCDICQDVCPWNRKAAVSTNAAFLPRRLSDEASSASSTSSTSFFSPSLEFLASLTEDDFRQVFRLSAVKRAKWRGLVRNACVALGNSGVRPGTPAHARVVALLEHLGAASDAVIAEHARWALAQLERAG